MLGYITPPSNKTSKSLPPSPMKKKIKFHPLDGEVGLKNENEDKNLQKCCRSLDFSSEEINKKRKEGFNFFYGEKKDIKKNLVNKKFCKNIIYTGQCNIEGCSFAHSLKEFNPSCMFGYACKYQGDKCKFLHPNESFEQYCKLLNIPVSENQPNMSLEGENTIVTNFEIRGDDHALPFSRKNSSEEQNPISYPPPPPYPYEEKDKDVDLNNLTISDYSEENSRIMSLSQTPIIPASPKTPSSLETPESPIKNLTRDKYINSNIPFCLEEKYSTPPDSYCIIPSDINIAMSFVKMAIDTGKKSICITFNDK